MSKKQSLGRVAPVFVGEWEWGKVYDAMEMVHHEEKSWVALDTADNIEPGTNDEYWALVAEAQLSEQALIDIENIVRTRVENNTHFVTDNNYHHTDINFDDYYKGRMDRIMSTPV